MDGYRCSLKNGSESATFSNTLAFHKSNRSIDQQTYRKRCKHDSNNKDKTLRLWILAMAKIHVQDPLIS
eukprot:3448469-Amphidinium_carterae.1